MIHLSVWQTTLLCTLLNQHSTYSTAASFPKAAIVLARIALKQLHDDCPPNHIHAAYTQLATSARQCLSFLNATDLTHADTQLDQMNDVLQFDDIALKFFTTVGWESTKLVVNLCPLSLVQNKAALVRPDPSALAIIANYGVLIIE